MTSSPDQTTCERYLARRADVKRERERLAGLRGTEIRRQRAEIAAALREEALELAISSAARELATQQGEQGDVQAAEALARVSTLDEADADAERKLRTSTRGSATPMIAEAPEPFIQLRERLSCARGRGLGFAEAWTIALQDWETPWRLAANGTISAWRASYEYQGDRFMATLAEQAADHGERIDTAMLA